MRRSSGCCARSSEQARANIGCLDWTPTSIPNAPINTIREVFDNPQIKHLGIPKQITHPKMGISNLVGSPINMSDTPPKFFRPRRCSGEHTNEVLAQLGYDEATMKNCDNGVI